MHAPLHSEYLATKELVVLPNAAAPDTELPETVTLSITIPTCSCGVWRCDLKVSFRGRIDIFEHEGHDEIEVVDAAFIRANLVINRLVSKYFGRVRCDGEVIKR